MSTLTNFISADEFFIYGKPNIRDVFPYTINISNSASSPFIPCILYGRNFTQIQNLYLSGSNPNILNNVTFFNPFSSDPSLYPTNPGFHAAQVLNFSFTDKNVYFDLPPLLNTGFLDVILENEAGYSILSRDTYFSNISSYSGWKPIFVPCISGIQLVSR